MISYITSLVSYIIPFLDPQLSQICLLEALSSGLPVIFFFLFKNIFNRPFF